MLYFSHDCFGKEGGFLFLLTLQLVQSIFDNIEVNSYYEGLSWNLNELN